MSTPSADFPYAEHYSEVLGSKMHYVDEGDAGSDPILLLHGNPTSSYLWRNVIPYLKPHGRVVAVDLIGMGKSDKPDIDYRIADHVQYLEAFIESLGLKNITLVIHDWGSALGFNYAMRNPQNVKGIAFMEGVTNVAKIADMKPPARQIFKLFRTPIIGKLMIQNANFFVNKLLPMSVSRKLTDAEMKHYRAPFPTIASRRPLYRFPNEIPFDGKPADTDEMVRSYRAALEKSTIPKLLLWFKPGALITKATVADLEAALPNLKSVFCGTGIHFVQEDQPDRIGEEVALWMQENNLVG